jgi:transposase-like protein
VDDLSTFCCLNPRCPDHGVRGGENLSVCRRYGEDGAIRFLRCRSCGDRFSERKGTPMFRSHLAKAKATALLEHVAEGCGVRQTERLVGVHRDTVTRYTRKAGDHAAAAHDEPVALSPPDRRGPVR